MTAKKKNTPKKTEHKKERWVWFCGHQDQHVAGLARCTKASKTPASSWNEANHELDGHFAATGHNLMIGRNKKACINRGIVMRLEKGQRYGK